MTRFAKIPEEILETLPVRLVGRYAWLAMHADYGSGEVRAASWPELAVMMRCSESQARRALDLMRSSGAVSGEPPSVSLTHRVRTNASTDASTNANTPILQRVSENNKGLRILPLWADFIEGRSGERPSRPPPAPRAFADAVRAVDADPETLSRICRLAGESYSDWDGVPNFANAMERGLAALSRGERVRPMTGKEWLDA